MLNGSQLAPCPHLSFLLDQYDSKVREYSRVVAELRRRLTSDPDGNVAAVCDQVRRAKEECEVARLAFERHRAEHDS